MSNFLQKVDKAILGPFYKQFINSINKSTLDCNSVLDIGCGYNPQMKILTSRMQKSVGLDVFLPSIEKAKLIQTHSEFVLEDVKTYLEKMPNNSFDAVIALDLIEHLTKEEGFWLMKQMERLAIKKVIIFTPNGFVPQTPYDNNPFQEHLSGWEIEEMEKEGYKILGFGGYKKLRGERFSIKFKPRIFWKYFSFGTQLFLHNKPKNAYSILCVKNLC